MEGIHWVLLTLAMAVVSLGMSGIVKAIGAITAFLVGSICLIYGLSTSSQLTQRANIWFDRRVEDKETKMPCKSRMPDTSAPNSAGLLTTLTGMPIIDSQLNQIIGYIFRDYVYAWHFDITHSSAFPSEAEDSLNIIVANLAFKIREVDLITFLTTRLVDDVASHVRLFKQARAALKNLEDQSISGENCKQIDLESLFFDAEVSMEGTVTCRDQVSSSQPDEILYLQNVAETLLFVLLPEFDFNAIPLRTLLRELLVNVVFKPLLDLISDPDTINQSLVLAVAGNSAPDDYSIKHDVFTSSIRYSDSLEELQATREMVSDEISCLRSNDSKGGSGQKQQLNSLLYLRKVIDARIHVLQSGAIDSDSISGLIAGSHYGSNVDWNQMIGPGLKLFSLPIEVILKNNIAIGYFIDYMSFLGCASYVYFYLNIEGWKVSTEQQIQAIQLDSLQQQHQTEGNESKLDNKQNLNSNQHKSLMENMREAAHSIYEEYLSEKANPRLKLDDSILKRLLFKIRTEPPNSEWFDEVQVAVYSKLETDERFLESFKRSIGYVKLLAELDLLKDPSAKSEAGDEDRISTGDSNSLNGETLDDNLSGVQSSCLSIYGDKISLNSYDSANYSYDSIGTTSTNEIGSNVGHIRSSSSDKLDILNESKEPKSLPLVLSAKTTVSDMENASPITTAIQTAAAKQRKAIHKRTGSNLSDSIKPADSDYESERRNSPRPSENQKHYQTALFMGGGHWAAASTACGDTKHENVTNLDQTLMPEPLDHGDKERETEEEGSTTIDAEVMRVTIVKESVSSYAIYTIRVHVRENWGTFKEDGRDVFRRYSDFHALHEKICNQYPKLHLRLPEFPSKKTFGNMDKQLLEKRRHMFNSYLKALLRPSIIKENFGLIILLERFLDHSSAYEKDTHLRKAVGSVKSSVKSVKSAVTSMPNNLVNTVGFNLDGLKGALHMRYGPNSSANQNKDFINTERVGANIDVETSDNIPLRILLLFMDEVFDLKEKNQWLRRQIVAVLRQLIKAMFGDIVNRRIVDYFAQMTSPETLSSYLESFKQSFWPNGYPAADREPRDENTKMRTRVAARAAMFSSFSDDLRRLIGSETTRSGLLMLFEMLQHPVLNKRLGIVILEGILELLFQEQDFKTIFQKLHSRSSRVRNELRNSQRKYADIRR